MGNQFQVILIVCIVFSIVNNTNFSLECETDQICQQNFTDDYFCVNKLCKHRNIQFDNYKDIFSLVLILFTSGLTNIGGVGGGEILVPLFVFAFNFTIDNAIPLSKLTIFSGAITNIFIIFNKRLKENKNKFLINYHLVFFQLPLIFGGTLLGVQLMKLIPTFIIFIFLIVYLSFSTFKMFAKAYILYKKETQDKLEQSNTQLNNINTNGIQDEMIKVEEQRNINDQEIERKGFFSLFSIHIKNLVLCMFVFALVLGIAVFSKLIYYKNLTDLYKGNIIVWSIIILIQTICFIISIYIMLSYRKKAQKTQQEDDKQNYVLMKDFFLASYETGILSGMLGIGGGMIINPKLVSYGLDPEVSAAISATIVLFTSMSTTFQFFILEAFDAHNMIILGVSQEILC